MAKLHVAKKTGNGDPNATNTDSALLVERSMTTLKERLRNHPDTAWSVATYEVPTDVGTVAKLVEGLYMDVLSSCTPENSHSVRVNAQGQVRNN